MTFTRTRVVAAVLAAATTFTGASVAIARITEIGKIGDTPAPSCPDSPCLAVSKTTGVQVKIGDRTQPFKARRDGRLVAFSVTLGKPTKEQVKFFNGKLGGEPAAKITVMRPGDKLYYRVTGESEVFPLKQYYGKTVQFALKNSLTIKKGYVVALTIPTWAPALAVGVESKNSWRASRQKPDCSDTAAQTALVRKDVGRFTCLYRTARLTYTATIISTP